MIIFIPSTEKRRERFCVRPHLPNFLHHNRLNNLNAFMKKQRKRIQEIESREESHQQKLEEQRHATTTQQQQQQHNNTMQQHNNSIIRRIAESSPPLSSFILFFPFNLFRSSRNCYPRNSNQAQRKRNPRKRCK